MSFGEIINMYRDKEIIISPEYQRLVDERDNRMNDVGIPRICATIRGKWE